jgi:hypothetical protein
MMNKIVLSVLTAVFLILTGCAGTDDDGPEEYPELSLGWARLLAEEVRDAEIPEGELTYVFAGYVDEDGLIVDEDSYHEFFFTESVYPADVSGLWVIVYYSGETDHCWEFCDFDTPLPTISDAGPWIMTADDALETIGGVDYTHRTYEVREAVFYQNWADFVVQVDYWGEHDRHRARVFLDAETGELIDVEDFR